jgi:hypothetical protein
VLFFFFCAFAFLHSFFFAFLLSVLFFLSAYALVFASRLQAQTAKSARHPPLGATEPDRNRISSETDRKMPSHVVMT